MYKHTLIIGYFINLLLTGGICGCTALGGQSDPLQLPDPITVALPYVEAVHFPAEIHAGQAFSIIVDLSSAANPLALRSPERPFPLADHGSYAATFPGGIAEFYTVVIKPFRDPAQASNSLPVQASVTYDFDPIPAGEYTLRCYSAASREQGGMNITFDRQILDWGVYSPTDHYQTFAFTVLP